MAYTNVTIPEMFCSREEQRKKVIDLEHEVTYWKKRAERAEDVLRNIPEAVEQYGHVDISYDKDKKMTLVKEQSNDTEA